jgi:hypothetical protein
MVSGEPHCVINLLFCHRCASVFQNVKQNYTHSHIEQKMPKILKNKSGPYYFKSLLIAVITFLVLVSTSELALSTEWALWALDLPGSGHPGRVAFPHPQHAPPYSRLWKS